MKFITLRNTKLNKLLLIENVISFFFFIYGLVFLNNQVLYTLGSLDIIFIYLVLLIKLIRRKDISIIEIFLAFFFLYVMGTYIFFNNNLFKELILNGFVRNVPDPTQKELLLMNSVLYIYTKLLILPVYDTKFYVKRKKDYFNRIKSEKFHVIPYIVMFFFIFYLLYLVKSFSHYNDFNGNSGPAFSIIGYFSFLISILIIITDQYVIWYKRLGKTLLTLVCVALIAKIGSRTYAVYVLFSLLLNLKKRGLKFGNKIILSFLLAALFLILYQGLARIGMNGINDAFSVLTLFGEFFLPSYSYYYYLNNPLNYIYFFAWTDFIVKVLPTKFLPLLSINQFMEYYSLQNIYVAPVGGMFLYGQIIYYFGIFGIIFVVLLAIFLSFYKIKSEQKGNIEISFIIPIMFLILPRQFLYHLPKTILLIFMMYFLIDFLLQKPYKEKIGR